jgi:cell division protein FtsB
LVDLLIKLKIVFRQFLPYCSISNSVQESNNNYKPFADRFKEEIDAFFRLWRERRWLAVVFVLALVGFCIYFLVGWNERGNKIQEQTNQINQLKTDNSDLARDNVQLRTENAGLRETVAPLLARAAKEFPGEEINSSLKKIIDKLESENPLEQPIASSSSTVEILIKSDQGLNAHFIDQGAFLAFGKGKDALLMNTSVDSFGNQTGKGEVLYHAILQMPADDSSVGKPISVLKDTEYLQAQFGALPDNCEVLGGKMVCVLNGSIRLKFDIPPQQSIGKNVFIRDMRQGLLPLQK